MKLIIPLIFAVFLLAGCKKENALKALENVDHLVIHDNKLKKKWVIKNEPDITQFKDYLSSKKKKWKSLWYTHPSHWYSIQLMSEEKTIARIMLGDGYISYEGLIRSNKNLIRSISEKEMDEIYNLIQYK